MGTGDSTWLSPLCPFCPRTLVSGPLLLPLDLLHISLIRHRAPPPPSTLLCSRFLPASVSHHCVSCLTVSLTLQPPREPAFSLTFLSSLINVSFKNRLRSIFIPRIGLKFYGLH